MAVIDDALNQELKHGLIFSLHFDFYIFRWISQNIFWFWGSTREYATFSIDRIKFTYIYFTGGVGWTNSSEFKYIFRL